MHNSKPRLILASLAAALFALPALAQQGPADLGEQMSRMSGALHATARACGESSDAELASMKQQQKANHANFGMDASSFDRGFDAGEREAEAKWGALTASQRAKKCTEVKQQMEMLGQQLGGAG
ncbi:hypothetical protein [Marilutibacter spongiae]|uniref:Uncharacterized protein n=1 Tax=Marilutibacter spongiae TaxID=2025720 RepID=A0A7W3TPV0_9GAMM|nr:hypothetical protein [Lysobacter spongiae]MBB1061984.1 hypothetical protein [Lysobacter spongiae]